MRRSFLIRSVLIAAASLALSATAAAAQSWSHDRSHGRGGSNTVPTVFDWRSQLDRPGDYRCDAFWDANRTDCGARWRDQRHRVSPQARRDYRALAGYRGNHGRYGRAWSHGYAGWRGTRRRGYGYASGAGTAWHAAYGRPDLVYPSGGYSGGSAYGGSRDPGRVDWCRSTYRSYDPRSGYYRAWSGRLIFCG